MANHTFKQAFLIVGAVVALPLVFAFSMTPTEEEIAAQEAERAADPTSGSKAACREFIERVLVSPSTAGFGHFAAWPAQETDSGTIQVSATLDGQNAYGAMVRQTMTCEVRKADGQWHLESLSER